MLGRGFCFRDRHRSARLKQQRDLHARSVNCHVYSERDRRGLVVIVGHMLSIARPPVAPVVFKDFDAYASAPARLSLEWSVLRL